MNVSSLAIPDVLLVKPRVFSDARGQFFETWRDAAYASQGIGPFLQDNISVSKKHVVRGLHLQHPQGQGKLVSALRGRIFDVAVDVRVGSPTFGQWVGEELTEENRWQLYIPVGFAHGFQALSDDVIFSYKCTDYYDPPSERTVRWNDPRVGISWPAADAIVAPKDAAAPVLADIPEDFLPRYRPRA